MDARTLAKRIEELALRVKGVREELSLIYSEKEGKEDTWPRGVDRDADILTALGNFWGELRSLQREFHWLEQNLE